MRDKPIKGGVRTANVARTLVTRMLRSIVSKAADRSNSHKIDTQPLSEA